MVFRPIFKRGFTAFNRTLLELKYMKEYLNTHASATFNRTLLELKFEEALTTLPVEVSFNRTLLELK